ncbi:site-specific integrase [Bradyrhizobium sp. 604_D8_N2_3]|uniref:site-specific integrase n=1 Tax=Bradyrhizobium sp. 604_D8_N2_3 TaxID=3240370 RepID=UPI003F25049C
MATARSGKLENRTNRLKLAARKKPYTVRIAPGIFLAYRRNEGAGTWSVKAGGKLTRFALADDFEDANGHSVLSYFGIDEREARKQKVPVQQGAMDKALALARSSEGNTAQLASVEDAVRGYAADLEANGGRKYNATQLDLHLDGTLLKKQKVALLVDTELRDWRDGLSAKGLKAASVNRIIGSMKSALNLAAMRDKRIGNLTAWKHGLERLSGNRDDDETVRDNYVLGNATVEAIVHGCYEEGRDGGDAFGELMQVLAETGTRESQAFRLKSRDLKDDNPADPYLLMPTSWKGDNRKRRRKVELHPLPITPQLARLLRQRVAKRTADQPLFDKIWGTSERFRCVLEDLDLDLTLTPYALRHSSIVRQLRMGRPPRLVAAHHDTSILLLERVYSRYILKPGDEQMRATLPDFRPQTIAKAA